MPHPTPAVWHPPATITFPNSDPWATTPALAEPYAAAAEWACVGCDAALLTPGAELPNPLPMCRRCRTIGVVYLLHFARPYKHAKHYTGWTTDLTGRLEAHANGGGARLLQVIHDAGIGWTLARTWPGDRHRERRLKNQGGASRCCPWCGIRPRYLARRSA